MLPLWHQHHGEDVPGPILAMPVLERYDLRRAATVPRSLLGKDGRLARPRWHFAVAAGVGLLQYRLTGRVLPALSPLISGFLIDGDHLLDYALYHMAPPNEAELAKRKMVLALHAWEFLLLVALLEPVALRGETARGLTLGYLAHLVVDQIANELEHPLTYSLLYRASRKFEGPFFKPNPKRAWRDEPLGSIILKRF